MTISLDWLGCATFRLAIDDLVIFLDAFMDRAPAAPAVGLTTQEVNRTDYVLVGHSHWNHLYGGDRIAHNTGATIVGSHETVRLMYKQEVPEDRLIAVAGGERIRLSSDVTIRVFPSQHSCIWANAGAPGEECIGDLGLTLQERQSNQRERTQRRAAARAEVGAGGPPADFQRPRGEGGAFAYLIETPEGSIFWKDTSGHWTGALQNIRPDVALLASAGRGNIDGEPIQGSLAQFMVREADLLRPRIVLSHHDDWTGARQGRPLDIEPIAFALNRYTPNVELVEMGYLEGYPIMKGIR
jgi:L-ascorbate metabolism protein UlaG (beta-lactamase superfamily)